MVTEEDVQEVMDTLAEIQERVATDLFEFDGWGAVAVLIYCPNHERHDWRLHEIEMAYCTHCMHRADPEQIESAYIAEYEVGAQFDRAYSEPLETTD